MSSSSGAWDGDKWKLETTLAQTHLLGAGSLFSSGIGQDDKDSSLNRIVVSMGVNGHCEIVVRIVGEGG